MLVSRRGVLAVGAAAIIVGATALAPSIVPLPSRSVEVLRPVALTTEGSAVAPKPVSDADVKAALEVIGELTPVPGRGKVTVRLGEPDAVEAPSASATPEGIVDVPTNAPAAAAAPDGAAGETSDLQTIDEPVALNTASDVIDEVYAFTRYWANYMSLELGPWLINWVPFGYLVSDQIYIWYPDFVLPVVDSFVYDFLDPVVNDPLNFQVWVDGISDIANAAVTGINNGIADEIQYIVDFGWFPIPLPPLPDFPLPSLASESAMAAVAAESTEGQVELTAVEAGETDVQAQESVTERVEPETTEPVEPETTDDATEALDEAEYDVAEETGDDTEPAAEEQLGEGSGDEFGDQAGEPADGADEDELQLTDEGDDGAGEEAQAGGEDTTTGADEDSDAGEESDEGDADSDGDGGDGGDAGPSGSDD